MRSGLLSGIIFLLLFSGCQSDSGLPKEQKVQLPPVAMKPEEILTNWNKAHNTKDYAMLKALYAPEVAIYNKKQSRGEAVQSKKEMLTADAGYAQFISDINIESYTPAAEKISFKKEAIEKGTAKLYNSYILIESNDSGNWKIIAESDSLSDQRFVRRKLRQIPASEITSCEKAAEAIFMSSPVVKKLLSYPYSVYKLEYAPEDTANITHRYQFWIFSSVPNSEMTETYGRFQVDVRSGQLYENKPDGNKLLPVTEAAEAKKYLQKKCGDRTAPVKKALSSGIKKK